MDRDAQALLHRLDERGRAGLISRVHPPLLAGDGVGDPQVPGHREELAARGSHAQHHDRVGALTGHLLTDECPGVRILWVDPLAGVGPDDQVVGAGSTSRGEHGRHLHPVDLLELHPGEQEARSDQEHQQRDEKQENTAPPPPATRTCRALLGRGHGFGGRGPPRSVRRDRSAAPGGSLRRRSPMPLWSRMQCCAIHAGCGRGTRVSRRARGRCATSIRRHEALLLLGPHHAGAARAHALSIVAAAPARPLSPGPPAGRQRRPRRGRSPLLTRSSPRCLHHRRSLATDPRRMGRSTHS